MLPKESAKNRIKKMWNTLKTSEKEEDLFPESFTSGRPVCVHFARTTRKPETLSLCWFGDLNLEKVKGELN